MKVNRVEQHNINKAHSVYPIINELCFKSKNLYNYANYIIRQEFINNKKFINYYDMKKDLKTHGSYKDLGSQASQQTLEVLDKNWKSFFKNIRQWSRSKGIGYLGKPRLPKYKDKDGRNIVIVSNTQCRIENGSIRFSWKPLKCLNGMIRTNVKDKLMSIRFIPKQSHYVMEIIYEKEIPETNEEIKKIIGIDLGVNNFATVGNNSGLQPFIIKGGIIKSMNQYYNKKKAELQSDLKLKHNKNWSNRLQRLTDKRNNKVKNFIHKTSKYIVNWCAENNIDTVAIGKSKLWKQECNLGRKNNQNFTDIPFELFIKTLKYKCEDVGIKLIETEEKYTSGTSFLDDELPIEENYNISRRIKRGLFKSNDGIMINADLNASYQIIKKVFAETFVDATEGVHLHPVKLSIV